MNALDKLIGYFSPERHIGVRGFVRLLRRSLTTARNRGAARTDG